MAEQVVGKESPFSASHARRSIAGILWVALPKYLPCVVMRIGLGHSVVVNLDTAPQGRFRSMRASTDAVNAPGRATNLRCSDDFGIE